MKRARTVFPFVFVLGVFWGSANAVFAQQNYLVNGDFSQGIAGWNLWQERFNTRVDIAGGDLHIYGGDSGSAMNIGANGGIYQVIPVTPGVEYQVTGSWQSDPTAPNSHWAEVIVLDGAVPVTNVDVGSPLLFKSDTFSGHGPWNGTFATASNTTTTDGKFTPTNNFISLLLKAGNVDFAGVHGTRFDDVQVLGPTGGPTNQRTVIYTGFEGSPGENLGTMSTNGTISSANPQVDSQSLIFDNTETPTNFNWTSDVVDVSGMTDVSLSFAWTAPGGAFETSDTLTFSVALDGVLTEILALDGGDLDANAPNVNNDGYWYETVMYNVPDGTQEVQLQIDALTTGADEDIFIDDIYIIGTAVAAVPEPASLVLWSLVGGALGLALWRAKRRIVC